MHNLLILCQPKVYPQYFEIISQAGLPDLAVFDHPTAEIDLVLGDPDLIRNALPQLPALRWAQSTWAGIEPLVTPGIRSDYILTNARGVFGGLISEYVLAYLLFHERKILQRLNAQQKSTWEPALPGSLKGKSIGLLGVGSIGAALAKILSELGMIVRGYTRQSQSCSFVTQYYHGDNLNDFASGLDYLVNILPNTPATKRIVNEPLLAQLPKHAAFINVGRGSAVDESALIYKLNHGLLAWAALDVFEQEPLPPSHPFWQTKNLFITSHTAAPSFPLEISNLFIENYQRYTQNLPMKFRVDFENGY